MNTVNELTNVSLIDLSLNSRLFAEKAARSVAEIQSGLSDVSEVEIFLEILGYDNDAAKRNGFSSISDLSNYVVNFIDFYEDKLAKASTNQFMPVIHRVPIESLKSRFFEAIAVQAPWIGAIVLLSLTGISLWMAKGLPADVTTFFVAGIFAGLILSEGLLQVFSRLLFTYYDQRNLGEVKRIIIRSFVALAVTLTLLAVIILTIFPIWKIPQAYTLLFLASAASVATHRISFNPLYVLKMTENVLAAYAAAFAVMMAVFFASPQDGTNITVDYFTSLAAAFGILSVYSAYSHIVAIKKIAKPAGVNSQFRDKIPFYKPHGTVRNTLKSRFWVQMIEFLPNFLSGFFFFIVLFGDRILSWIFNPNTLIISNISMPFAFNNQYHAGADLALLVMIPVAMVQYVLLSPLYARIQNKAAETRLRDITRLSTSLSVEYRKGMLAVIAVAGVSVMLLNAVGDNLISELNGSSGSLFVMRLASLGNFGLSILTTNLLFLSYINRSKPASQLILIAAALTLGLGTFFAQYGTFDIIIGYLISSCVVAILSTLYTRLSLRTDSVRALTKFS